MARLIVEKSGDGWTFIVTYNDGLRDRHLYWSGEPGDDPLSGTWAVTDDGGGYQPDSEALESVHAAAFRALLAGAVVVDKDAPTSRPTRRT